MEIWLLCSSVLLVMLTLGAAALLIRSQQRAMQELQETYRQALSDTQETQRKSIDLHDKAITLLSTKDPLAFQSVQAMSSPVPYTDMDYDPSDEAEARRLADLRAQDDEGEMSDAEQREFLRSIGADFPG